MTFDADYGPELTPTSVEELYGLAAYLWSQPSLRAIFEGAGFRGDWADEDQDRIDAAIQTYAEAHFEGLRDPLLLPLAAVVCRFVAGGRLPAVDSVEARAFIEDRHFSRWRLRSGLRSKKATVDEALMVIRDLRDHPVYWEAIKKYAETDIDETLSKNVLRPLYGRVIAKYGLRNRSPILDIPILRDLATGKISDPDDPKARSSIARSSLIKG